MPIRDRSAGSKPLIVALTVVSSLFIFQRFAFKFYAKLELGPDDRTTLVMFILNIPVAITFGFLMANGLGRDVRNVSFSHIASFFKAFYAVGLLYFAQITLLKLALLFFYLRIFPGILVRRLLWSTVVLNGLYSVIFILVTGFPCKPISHFWNVRDGEHNGHCASMKGIIWSSSLLSISLDIWMLSIPLSQIMTLNLGWKERFRLG